MISFEQILGSVEYSVIERTEYYLYFSFNSKEYVLYKEVVLVCFSITDFKQYTVLELIEQFIPLNNSDLISVSNCSNPCDLNFLPTNLSYVLGNCFKLMNLGSLSEQRFIDNDIPFMMERIDSRISKHYWKYSLEDKMFYLIPPKEHQTAFKFNTSNYFHYGKPLTITNGKNDVFYLNPYTLLSHLENGLIENNQKITIGAASFGRCVIRSTYQELFHAFDILTKDIGGYYTIDHSNTIKLFIKIPFKEISSINNSISGNLNHLVLNFEELTGIKYKNKPKIMVLPNPRQLVDGNPSTIVEFTNNLNSLQLIIEHLLNEYSKNYNVVNINYVPLAFIDKDNPNLETNDLPSDYYDNLLESNNTEEHFN